MMKAHATFFWQFLTRYRTTGAVAPSSRRLARQLARHVGAERNGAPIRVFEAGPGTGVVTREVLRHLQPQDRFVIYEANPKFVEFLQLKFDADPAWAPHREQVRLVQGFAQDCDESEFDHAVCGIPFTNFGADEVRAILQAMFDRLRPGGTLSYFEYVALRRLKYAASGRATRARLRAVDAVTSEFEHQFGAGNDLVLLNLPPATARHCRKPASQIAPR